MAFFDAATLCHAVILIFDTLTLKVRGTSSVTWSKSVQNLSEIEQFPAELLGLPTLVGKALSFTHELYLFLFINPPCSAATQWMAIKCISEVRS